MASWAAFFAGLWAGTAAGVTDVGMLWLPNNGLLANNGDDGTGMGVDG